MGKTKGISMITIYDLLPLLRKGYVAMDKGGTWHWYECEPAPDTQFWDPGDEIDLISTCCLSDAFNIAPFAGDWKDSLTECGKIIKTEYQPKGHRND